MGKVRLIAKPVSLFLAILMMVIFTPYQVVLAKMVTAETILDAGRVSDARAYVDSILAREDVKAAMIAQGIDADEAMLRTRALSDAEIISLADHMESLPPGATNASASSRWAPFAAHWASVTNPCSARPPVRCAAGSGGFETFLIVGLIVFLVLLFTDISGATDIFPFVKKNK